MEGICYTKEPGKTIGYIDMHTLKDYNKIIKVVEKSDLFEIKKTGRKTTLKITHLASKEARIVHPGEKAIQPLKKWLQRFKIST